MPEFQVPAGTDLERLEQQLVERLGLELDGTDPAGADPATQERTYYDTFDGRLYLAGCCLVAIPESRGVLLRCLPRARDDSRSLGTLRLAELPPFVRDMPPSRLREKLGDIIQMRALLPQARLQTDVRSFAQHDRQRKTIARLALERHRLLVDGQTRPIDTRLRVVPLQGYAKAHRRIVRALEQDFSLTQHTEDLLTSSLMRLGRRLDGYSSKIDVRLEPDMRDAL